MLVKIYLLKKIQNITKYLKLLKNAKEKELFTSVPTYSILHKERKKINKPNITADQVVDMQAVNFVLIERN